MKKHALYIIILCLVFLFAVQKLSVAAKFSDKILRVCVLKDADEFSLTIKGSYKIVTLKTNEFIKKGNYLRKAHVQASLSGLLIRDEPFRIFGIKIIPKKDASLYIGKRSFRGNLDIIRTENSDLLVINHINVEDYLKGVLYHEVSHWWPIETLKAQAIAARTYALYQKSQKKDKDYDLTNDIYSQVYGGKLSEKIRTNRAVDLTRDKVLTFKGEIFPTYYHATCGGYTENASNIWDIDLPPLKSVKCGFCKHSPHYKWKRKILISDFKEKINKSGYDVKKIKDIIPKNKTSSGRIKALKIIPGENPAIPANDFRLIVGPNIIRSTDFKVVLKDRYVYFRGRGWGHGVGMCQWGAFFLGLKWYKAGRILKHYYPGAKVQKI